MEPFSLAGTLERAFEAQFAQMSFLKNGFKTS